MTTQLIHIPKTAGTALASALGRAVHRNGHPFRLSHLKPGDLAITVVRDPVERFRSAFAWSARQQLWRWPSADALALDGPELTDDVFKPQSWWLDGELGRLLWVGRTETLDADVRGLASLLGIGDIRLPMPGSVERNATPHPHPPLSAEALEALRERYADDYALLEDLAR